MPVELIINGINVKRAQLSGRWSTIDKTKAKHPDYFRRSDERN